MSEKGLSPTTLFTASKRGKPLTSGARRNILNVYSRLREENPESTITDITEKTAELTGSSPATIFRLKREKKRSGILDTPGKKRPGAVGKRTRMLKYDNFTLSCIRRKVHSFFRRNEIPTLDKILKVVNDDKEIFSKNISRTTLYRILKDLGFSFEKRKKQAVLIERQDIILWRRNFLRKIRDYKKDNKSIYYLDETWVNEGHFPSQIWKDTTVKSSYKAASESLTVGLTEPKGKGRRLIITHIGSEEGFVPGAEDIFIGKKSGDYHEEMDGNHFEKWFESVLPKLKTNSIIVMDNAPYHSVKMEKIPNKSWNKIKIQEWLSEKNVSWSTDMIKIELLQKVSEVKHFFDKYRVEAIAEKYGHTVLRLPPYHCELNPIEMIWSQIKGYVARENRTFKLNDVKDLVIQGINNVTAENWINCIKHVSLKENEMWEIDGIVDEVCENQNLIISINSDSSDNDSELPSAEEM